MLDPVPDSRVTGKVEAAFVGDVGVGVEGDVRDGIASTDEELVTGKVSLHHPERIMTELAFALQDEPALLATPCRSGPSDTPVHKKQWRSKFCRVQ